MAKKDRVKAPKVGAALAAFVDGCRVVSAPSALTRADLLRAYGLRRLGSCRTWSDAPRNGTDEGRASAQEDEDGRPKAKRRKLEDVKKSAPCDCPPGAIDCLNRLGHLDWEIDDGVKARERMMSAAGLGHNPMDDDRDITTLVGLKNLGATCYMVWYQNRDFRKGVFACQPPTDDKRDDSALFQLQVIFAALQSGSTSVFNPKPLVTALRLTATEQQDAQEFGKLFVNLLDHEFQRQPDSTAAPKTLITDLFEGELRYRTICTACKQGSERKDVFTELSINLARGCELEKQLDLALAREELTGVNQYQCGHCDKMRDATRSVELVTLPPVLHFSLMRFVYDAKKEERKKSGHPISFPPRLDMSKWLADGSSAEYELTGVLDHRGASAHHGHYVAQVYDAKDEKWFKCDDETCEEIKRLGGPPEVIELDSGDEDDKSKADRASSPSPQSRPSSSKAAASSAPQTTRIKSKDAYMLVYTRVSDRTPEAIKAEYDAIEPPSQAMAVVDALAEQQSKAHDTYAELKSVVDALFQQEREKRRTVWPAWDVSEDPTGGSLLATSQLETWIKHTPEVPKLQTDEVKPAPTEAAATTNGSSSAETVAMEGVEQSKEVVDQLAPNGVNGHAELNGHADAAEPKPSPPTNEPNGHGKANGVTAVSNGDAEMSDAVDVVTAADLAAASPTTIDNSKLLCPHNKLDPASVELVKVISKVGTEALTAIGVDIKPVLSVDDALCADCVWQAVARKHYEAEHVKHTAHFKKMNGTVNKSSQQFLISKHWFTDWVKKTPQMHDNTTGLDPSPSSGQYRDHLLCEHGNLKVSKEDSKYINKEQSDFLDQLFDDYRPIRSSMSLCTDCQNDAPSDSELSRRKAIADKQKAAMRTIVAPDRFSPRSSAAAGVTYYLIPRKWVRSLAKFLKAPDKNEQPGPLDLSHLRCQHHQIVVDVEHARDMRQYDLVTEQEWDAIVKYYPAGDDAIAVDVNNDFSRSSDPLVCLTCRDESADVTIRTLVDADFDKDGNKLPVDLIDSNARGATQGKRPVDAASFYGLSAPTEVYGTRRSGRLGGSRPTKHDTADITVGKYDTVKDIKVILSTMFSVPTIYQNLWFGDRELTDNTETVASIGILPGDLIDFQRQEVDEKLDFSKLRDHVPTTRPRSGKSKKDENVVPEGFGGTGLHGLGPLHHQPAAAATSATAETNGDDSVGLPISEADQKAIDDLEQADLLAAIAKSTEATASTSQAACPQCTFLQSNQNTDCEICGMPMRS